MKKFYAFIVLVLAAFQGQAQWSTSGSDIYNTNGGGVGIGVTSPGAKLEVQTVAPLYSNGDNILMQRIANLGANSNYFQNNLWARRVNSLSGWTGINLHDAISIDGSFLTPFTDTRTFWERNPYSEVQTWGSSGSAYMQLTSWVLNVWGGGGLNAYSFNTFSDARFKSKGQEISNGLSIVKKLVPKEYTFVKGISKSIPQGKQSGLFAQELQNILPHLVSANKGENDQEYLAVNYIGLIPYLISAIQEQQKTIERQDVVIQSILNDAKVSTPVPAHDLIKPRLFQSNPNPSNGNTEVKYFIPNGSAGAAIHIYNLSGEQVVKFDNLVSGENSLIIGKGSLKPGLYIYSLVSVGQVWETKKMIILE